MEVDDVVALTGFERARGSAAATADGAAAPARVELAPATTGVRGGSGLAEPAEPADSGGCRGPGPPPLDLARPTGSALT